MQPSSVKGTAPTRQPSVASRTRATPSAGGAKEVDSSSLAGSGCTAISSNASLYSETCSSKQHFANKSTKFLGAVYARGSQRLGGYLQLCGYTPPSSSSNSTNRDTSNSTSNRTSNGTSSTTPHSSSSAPDIDTACGPIYERGIDSIIARQSGKGCRSQACRSESRRAEDNQRSKDDNSSFGRIIRGLMHLIPFDPAVCKETPSPQNTILTAILCIGTFLSYLPQHIKIVSRRSSDGISPYFILLGAAGAGSNITNIILLQFIALQCCTVQTLGVCVASLLGIVQVLIQGSMFYITFTLYMWFFPRENKYKTVGAIDSGDGRAAAAATEESRPLLSPGATAKQPTVEWQTALWVMSAVVTHATICILMSSLLVAVVGPYAAPTRTWASLLGLFSLCLTCIQFLPQILKTWRSGVVGALSIPMMLMQTPGGFLFAYSIAIRPGVNWSSWISTFVAATLQGVLLVICLIFDAREKRQHVIVVSSDTHPAQPSEQQPQQALPPAPNQHE
ncbi:hypothetical protein LPJ81_001398 [Coemansia sp. IMI 209127]|nr:hypothetical protein LPJ81_001398 [Coemansia sp. IMI 209127]